MLNLLKRARQFRIRQEEQTKATRLILEKNLTGDELSEYVNLYDDWDDTPVGKYIAELSYLRYDGKLYQCLQGQGHEKQVGLNPQDSSNLFIVIRPDDALPIDDEQIQPEGE